MCGKKETLLHLCIFKETTVRFNKKTVDRLETYLKCLKEQELGKKIHQFLTERADLRV